MQKDNDILLLKGNEAIAHAAIRYGYDGFFGYPITPQSEILETLTLLKPWETTGMVVLQSESEVASINMIYAGGGTGKCVLTSSSSVGVSLMQEIIPYMVCAETPGLLVSVQRGGPGLGTIQSSQGDYQQAVYGGGNGDYHTIVLAPCSVQESCDMVGLAKDLMFKWRTPVIILSDGSIGQMMEKCILPPYTPRRTDEEILQQCPWAANGLGLKGRKSNVTTSLELDQVLMEKRNKELQAKYRQIEQEETRTEHYLTDDAETVIVAFGSAARISMGAVDLLRKNGHKVGLLRPITLWPFPNKEILELATRVKRIVVVELNEGQMLRDVQWAAQFRCPIDFIGHSGGVVITPDEIVDKVCNAQ
ncbi:MAG: 3-methyl-2-oxobutanoate dehydrogenase subunit VorB [Bacteroidaceae bacterium]|nr:3-methyl-2-oxobutanoate dehydrogenase subunit VorB [Bacteroidaceae bacterium]